VFTPFLAALDKLPWELILFLVAGVITMISKLVEKAKKARAESVRQEKVRSGQDRMALPGVEADVRRPPPAPPPSVPQPSVVVSREKTTHGPKGTGGWQQQQKNKKRGVVPGRTSKRRIASAPVATRIDEHYVIGKKQAHPIVARIRGNRMALREAILLREIFGPPVALRGRHRPGVW